MLNQILILLELMELGHLLLVALQGALGSTRHLVSVLLDDDLGLLQLLHLLVVAPLDVVLEVGEVVLAINVDLVQLRLELLVLLQRDAFDVVL